MTHRWFGVVALLFAGTGCIVAPPPEYEEPARTPPILDMLSAKPFSGSVIFLDRMDLPGTTDKVDFKIPVRSDDQGEALVWVLYVDRTFSVERVDSTGEVPASTLDDMSRYIPAQWQADSSFSKGCHSLSFVVAHASSWIRSQKPELLDPSDAAVGTWWVNVDGIDPNTLVRCPNHGEIEQ